MWAGWGIRGDALAECEISRCHVHHTGASGVSIFKGEDISFSHNHIHHVGVYYSSAAGAILRGEKIHIHGNEIHDAPYSGIICAGKDHQIEQNLVYMVMRELHDGAAIYGTMRNCIVRDNFVRNVVKVGEGFGVSAYYLDGGSRDCVVERNVAQGVSMPTHNNIARDITIRDNVFIAYNDMTVSFQRSVGCVFERNTLFVPGKLKVRQPNAIKAWQDNVVFQSWQGKDNAPLAFTVGNAAPAVCASDRKAQPAEVVRVKEATILDGEIGFGEWLGRFQELDRDPFRYRVGGAPVPCQVFL